MDIAHVARLAQLPLTPEEEKTYVKQLDEVLGYVDQLQKIDTSQVSETVSTTDEANITRPDKIEECEPLIKGLVKTKAIFSKDE